MGVEVFPDLGRGEVSVALDEPLAVVEVAFEQGEAQFLDTCQETPKFTHPAGWQSG